MLPQKPLLRRARLSATQKETKAPLKRPSFNNNAEVKTTESSIFFLSSILGLQFSFSIFSKRSIIDLQLLVAVLISTVTFAASFTMPGGYEQGMAVLAGMAAFKAFVISNIAAFGFSILALFLQFDTCFVSDRLQVRYTKVVPYSMYVATLAMVLAFACGTYVVLCRNTGLGIVPFVVSGCLVTMYVIGGFLDPEAPFWWLRLRMTTILCPRTDSGQK